MPRSDNWETPKDVFLNIEKWYLKDVKFDVDLCASESNTKVSKFISESMDLFHFSPDFFKNFTAGFMNPPYRKKSIEFPNAFSDFLNYAYNIRKYSSIPVAVLVSTIISSSQTFQELVGPTPTEQKKNNAELYFYPKRIKFIDENGLIQKVPSFSSMVIIFRPFEDIQ